MNLSRFLCPLRSFWRLEKFLGPLVPWSAIFSTREVGIYNSRYSACVCSCYHWKRVQLFIESNGVFLNARGSFHYSSFSKTCNRVTRFSLTNRCYAVAATRTRTVLDSSFIILRTYLLWNNPQSNNVGLPSAYNLQAVKSSVNRCDFFFCAEFSSLLATSVLVQEVTASLLTKDTLKD